ncbi:class I SAM-dependent methyltransferase [Spiractinospora alimapuensis]|uniref:SAM-dependent methyltransferase n=1 Tax=Spiractinospora alimapuensis TaxID=2820884 RepID=UPI001F1771F0|nr:SAM-dependent methyltransferase [Spiractinospora alimapuensis]
MSTGEFPPDWLAAREVADGAARARSLLEPLATHLAQHSGPLEIHDIGAGTGSMRRWLARRLPGPQHWVLHDSDPRLLAEASRDAPGDESSVCADGSPVTVETWRGDLTRLEAGDFAGAALVTGSAVLDLLTHGEVAALARACAAARCAVLWSLSVTGRVELTPPHALDSTFAAAFDAHQRRTTAGRTLLGPDAPLVAARALQGHGLTVLRRPSPWNLGNGDHILLSQWLHGWVGAALDQCPRLIPPSRDYLSQRMHAIRQGTLRAVIDHEDLLALPTERG